MTMVVPRLALAASPFVAVLAIRTAPMAMMTEHKKAACFLFKQVPPTQQQFVLFSPTVRFVVIVACQPLVYAHRC
jgi:hypothetical protein